MHTDEIKAALLKSKQAVEETRERQTERVKELVAAHGVTPRLAIVQIKDDPVINTYVGVKKRYGASIGAKVDIHKIPQARALSLLAELNADDLVHGIIVQLPVEDASQTEEIVEAVSKQKDVDGLSSHSPFTPATPLAILWLLKHYKVDMKDKKVVVVGRGALVGAPLMRLLDDQDVAYENLHSRSEGNEVKTRAADVVITAVGRPGLIKSDDIKSGAVVVDAGTSTAGGKTVGDVEDALYQRDDVTVTPKRGGVGPLTVCALFENVLAAYSNIYT